MPIDWQYVNFCAAVLMNNAADRTINALSIVYFNATPEQREVLVSLWPNVFETYRNKYKEKEKKTSVTGENPLPEMKIMYITPAADINNKKWRKLK